MDKHFHKEFNKCPCCGSEERFLEQLGDEMKSRGLARESWSFHLDAKSGAVVDKSRDASIPIGSEVPGFILVTDICINCGCVYAIELNRVDVKKTVIPTQIPPLNRAGRRRIERGGGSPLGSFSSS